MRNAISTGRWAALLAALLLTATGTAHGDNIYRWVDSAGHVHFGDQPSSSARRLVRIGSDHPVIHATVRKVLDGDTIVLGNGVHVRLIGINAPELPHRGHPGQRGGHAATRALRGLIEGKRIRVVPGRDRHDHYGRLLAYLYLPDGTDINKWLLSRGFAHAEVRPPNLAHAKAYFRTEAKARAAHRGVWALAHYRIHPASAAPHYFNTFVRLRGRVIAVSRKSRYTYLTLTGNLVGYLLNARLTGFRHAGRDPMRLRGRTVVLRGWVHRREGVPRILLRDPLQIESVGG